MRTGLLNTGLETTGRSLVGREDHQRSHVWSIGEVPLGMQSAAREPGGFPWWSSSPPGEGASLICEMEWGGEGFQVENAAFENMSRDTNYLC